MSRTDKDVPYWVDVEYWEPYHYRCGNSYRSYWGIRQALPITRECDLPAEPRVLNFRISAKSFQRCFWDPEWPKHDPHGRTRSHTPPPARYIDHIGNAPSRRRLRDDCRQAIKEYRATGEVDIIPPTDQHRHCGQYLWW